MNQHIPNFKKPNAYYDMPSCRYCNAALIYNKMKDEYLVYADIFKECISDNEKIIKDLLE